MSALIVSFMKEAALILAGYLGAVLSGILVKRFRPDLSDRKAEALGMLALMVTLGALIALAILTR